MDGFSISNLPSVSLRMLDADRSAKSIANLQSSSSTSAPVDLVEMTGAVRPPDPFDAVVLNNRAKNAEEKNIPSLTSLLDEIKQYMETALDSLRASSKEFFEELEGLRSTLGDAKNADLLRTVGELVAVSDGTDSNAFLTAASELVKQTAGPESVLLRADQGPEELQVEVSDLALSIQPTSPEGLKVNLDSVRIGIKTRSQEQEPAPLVELGLGRQNSAKRSAQSRTSASAASAAEQQIAVGSSGPEIPRTKTSPDPAPLLKPQSIPEVVSTKPRAREVELKITKGEFTVSVRQDVASS